MRMSRPQAFTAIVLVAFASVYSARTVIGYGRGLSMAGLLRPFATALMFAMVLVALWRYGLKRAPRCYGPLYILNGVIVGIFLALGPTISGLVPIRSLRPWIAIAQILTMGLIGVFVVLTKRGNVR